MKVYPLREQHDAEATSLKSLMVSCKNLQCKQETAVMIFKGMMPKKKVWKELLGIVCTGVNHILVCHHKYSNCCSWEEQVYIC